MFSLRSLNIPVIGGTIHQEINTNDTVITKRDSIMYVSQQITVRIPTKKQPMALIDCQSCIFLEHFMTIQLSRFPFVQ